jgi:4,5-DOPA dioxygenase extradiol
MKVAPYGEETPMDSPFGLYPSDRHTDFDLWAAEALERGDVDTLANHRHAAPGMPFAHPTVEHYTPILVTLGAATDAEAGVRAAIEGFAFGLSKRSFQIA